MTDHGGCMGNGDEKMGETNRQIWYFLQLERTKTTYFTNNRGCERGAPEKADFCLQSKKIQVRE